MIIDWFLILVLLIWFLVASHVKREEISILNKQTQQKNHDTQPILFKIIKQFVVTGVSLGRPHLSPFPKVNLSSHTGSTQTWDSSITGTSPCWCGQADQTWERFGIRHALLIIPEPDLWPSHCPIPSSSPLFFAPFDPSLLSSNPLCGQIYAGASLWDH